MKYTVLAAVLALGLTGCGEVKTVEPEAKVTKVGDQQIFIAYRFDSGVEVRLFDGFAELVYPEDGGGTVIRRLAGGTGLDNMTTFLPTRFSVGDVRFLVVDQRGHGAIWREDDGSVIDAW